MPLQIRRGTAADRNSLTSPLVIGELLYVTDQGKLYIGDGTALGGTDIAGATGQGGKGLLISGFTNEEAQDATRDLFDNGAHTNISFTYDDSANSLSAVVDLTTYNGNITVNGNLTTTGVVETDDIRLNGTIIADDSTLLVDGQNGQIVGPIQSINGVFYTNTTAQAVLEVVSATTNPLSPGVLAFRRSRGTTGAPTAVINGDVSMNMLSFGHDGTQFIANAAFITQTDAAPSTGVVPARIGFATMDTTGSLANRVTIGSDGRFSVLGGTSEFFNTGSTAVGDAFISGRRSRGTVASPTVVNLDDQIYNFVATAFDGSTYTAAATIGAAVDNTVSSGVVPGRIYLATSGAAGGSPVTRLTVDSTGRTTAFFGLSSDVNIADAQSIVSFNAHTSTTTSSNLSLRRSRGTTLAPTAILSNDYIHNINWQGWDGSNFITGAQIRGRAVGTVSTGNVQGQLQFRFRNSAGALNTAIFADADNVEFRVPFGNQQIVIDGNDINGIASNDDIRINPSGTGTVDLIVPTQSTVGSAGGASALPASPTTYFKIKVDGVEYVIPAFAVS